MRFSARVWMPVACLVLLAAADTATRYARRPAAPDGGAAPRPVQFLAEPYPLPPFAAKDIDGREVSSSTWRGKVALLNFWATWCLPCRKEIPAIAALQEKYRADLVVVGLLQDAVSIDVVRAFSRSLRVNYPIVQTTAEIDAVTGQVLALPTTWLIDRGGRVVSTHVGEIDPAHVEREIQALIAASGGSF
jgi:thiol-disulfide isomerase/thioredoxin